MKAFFDKYLPKYLLIAVLILIFSNLGVYYGAITLNELLGRTYLDMTGSLDLATPFLPGFSFFYVAAYPFWYLSYYFLCRRSRELCREIIITDVAAKLFCGLLFILIPTTNVRPELADTGAANAVLGFIYHMDKPHNLFPSIHCLESWLCFVYIRKVSKEDNPGLCIFSFVLMAGICLSTVFTRQHVWVDVLAGIIIAEGFKLLVPYLLRSRSENNSQNIVPQRRITGTQKLKILITTDYYSPAVNGVVTSVSNLKEGLEKQGHEVRILTLSPDVHSHKWRNVYYIGSVSVDWLYPNTRFKLTPAHQLVKELITWHPDVVHSQCEFSTYPYACRIASICSAPLVHTYHTVYEDYTHYFCPSRRLGRMLAAEFTRHALKHTDCVIAPSAKVSKILHNYHIAAPTEIVPTGIDVERFAATPSQDWIRMKRKMYGLCENNLTLLYIGRLAKEKNLSEIFGILHDYPELPAKLLVVGDGPERTELEDECTALGIESKVIFTGLVPPSEVNCYYHLGDVFVNASTSETQGLTYFEAMAAGLPLLCRKDTCLDGIVIDDETGWQYTTPGQFASAVNKLFYDGDLRRAMALNAKMASKKFSKAVFTNKIESVYRHCLAG